MIDFNTLRQIASECGIQVTIATPAQEANAKKCLGGFAERIAAIEREECAQIAQTPVYGEQDDLTMAAKDRIAAAIRSRA